MSDLDFDKLITEGLAQGPADMSFRTRLKQESGRALTKGRQRRLWYLRAGLTCLILLVTVSAFWSGRITLAPQLAKAPIALTNPTQNNDTILVAKDLVTWLEAARFFKQLGMEERANKAFQLASSLTPSMEPQARMTSQNTETRFANLLDKEKGLSSLLAHYDACVEKHQETTNEDCHVVPPRNDDYSTLAPFASALGYKTAVIARNEAIFNCLFPHKSRQTSGRTLVTLKRKHLTIIAQSIGGKRHDH